MRFDVWNEWNWVKYNITFTLFEFKYMRMWEKNYLFKLILFNFVFEWSWEK